MTSIERYFEKLSEHLTLNGQLTIEDLDYYKKIVEVEFYKPNLKATIPTHFEELIPLYATPKQCFCKKRNRSSSMYVTCHGDCEW